MQFTGFYSVTLTLTLSITITLALNLTFVGVIEFGLNRRSAVQQYAARTDGRGFRDVIVNPVNHVDLHDFPTDVTTPTLDTL